MIKFKYVFKMTPSRLKVLTAFRRDPCATLRELAKRTGMSLSGVQYNMTALAGEGLITYNREVGNYNHKSHKGATQTQQSWNRMKQTRLERRDGLQARMDKVVAAAKEKEASGAGREAWDERRDLWGVPQGDVKGTRIG